MKRYKFKHPFQGNRKGDIVTEDRFGQLLVKAGSNNVMWTPKEVFRAMSMGLIEEENKEATVGFLKPYPPFANMNTGIPPRMLGDKSRGTGVASMVLFCSHPKAIREGDEYYCPNCKKRWEANEQA